jgi:4-alpha-glucanotransferase
MRHAGALRIDHVMALQHLFWIPSRPDHAGGAYVRYPLHDLLRIIALESRRNRCLVIGEDLGTVPEGFRPALQRAGILSYKVLYFERGLDQGFIAPEHYPADALVAVSTHDLPTLKGFWTGHDQDWRARLGLYPNAEVEARERADRGADRRRLLGTMRWVGPLPPSAEGDPDTVAMTPELAAAVHAMLARSPGRIMMVQAEDALGEIDQPNLPGTVDEHPNWRRRLPVTVETFADQPAVRALAEVVGRFRAAPERR